MELRIETKSWKLTTDDKNQKIIAGSYVVKCGKETVGVKISRDDARATAGCSSCGLNETFPIKIAQTEVDIYCMLTDKVFASPKKTLILDTQKDY